MCKMEYTWGVQNAFNSYKFYMKHINFNFLQIVFKRLMILFYETQRRIIIQQISIPIFNF